MNELSRCGWCGSQLLYQSYHDTEWGVPEYRPHELFERLMLECMQAGLSWWTVLQKRSHMRSSFYEFNPDRLATCNEQDILGWLADPSLIRHRGKLEAMVVNARASMLLEDFSAFVWSAVDGRPVQNSHETQSSVQTETAQSRILSQRLRNAGFRFVGPTTAYAFMQSVGMVNDHLTSCHRYEECRQMDSPA
jgi:DNA-3-methyladenine glycosylase I